MGIFQKLFRRSPKPMEPRHSNAIRVLDGFGRTITVEKEEWRQKVLPHNIRLFWDDPEQLLATVVNALHDGFFADVVEAAEHLYATDTIPARGTSVYAITLMNTQRLDEAEHILKSFLELHEPTGDILTNLSKVYTAQGLQREAAETMWRSLCIDPNQANALDLYAAGFFEQGGKSAQIEAWKRVAALPNSWRSQLWLARAALEGNKLSEALGLYREGLSHGGAPVPKDYLVQMSGDLGIHGYPVELIELTNTYFAPDEHGIEVGSNLIRAYLETGALREGREVFLRLSDLRRSDWKSQLTYWKTEFLKRGELCDSAW